MAFVTRFLLVAFVAISISIFSLILLRSPQQKLNLPPPANPERSKYCILVLCRSSNEYVARFIKRVRQKLHYDCFGICNELDTVFPDVFVNVSESECRSLGATNLTLISEITAWDKGLTWAMWHRHEYSHFWFLEDDVYIPCLSFFHLYDTNESESIDLFAPPPERTDVASSEWHWPRVKNVSLSKWPLPWFSNWAQCLRLTSRFLINIEHHLRLQEPNTHMIEYMFTTVAHHNGASTRWIEGLTKIEKGLPEIEVPEVARKYVYHPVKDENDKLRYDAIFSTLQGYL